MKAHKIKIKGLKKSPDETIELSDVNLIVGPNRSGKTTVIDALLLALSGETRDVGKKSIRDLMAGTVLDIEIHWKDGSILARTWKVNRKGALSSSVAGEELGIDPLLFDPMELVRKPEGQVRDLVAAAIAATAEKFDWKRFEKESSKITIPAKHADTITAILEDVALGERDARLSDASPIGWLRDEVARQKEKQREAAGVAKRFREALAASESTQTAPPGNEAELRARDEALTEEAEAIEVKHANAQSINQQRAELLEIQARRTEAERSLESIEADLKIARKALANEEASLHGMRGSLQSEIEKEDKAIDACKVDRASLLEERQKILVEVNADAELLAKIQGSDDCPICRTAGEHWKPLIIGEIEGRNASNEKFLAENSEAIGRIDERLKKHRDEKQRLQNELETKSAQLNKTADVHRTAINQRERDHARITGRLETMPKVDEIPDPAEVPNGDRLEIIAKERKDIAAKLHAFAEFNAVQKAKETNREQAESAEVETMIRKEVAGILDVMLREMIEKTVAPVLAPMNEFVAPILGDTLEWHDDGLKLTSGAASLRVMSGLERTVCAAGIAYALAQQSEFRLLALDELGNLAPDVRNKLLRTVQDFVKAGKLDQFIGVLPVDSGERIIEFLN